MKMIDRTTIYRKWCLTDNNILYHKGDVIRLIQPNLPSCRYPRTDRLLEKAITMDKSNAMIKIMTLLNEDGRMIPGDKTHTIVMEYLNFKIDRMGPEEALEDVRHTKDHLIAQIHQMAM